MLSYQEILNQIIGVLDVEFDFCYDINKIEFKEDEIFVNVESGTNKFESKFIITEKTFLKIIYMKYKQRN